MFLNIQIHLKQVHKQLEKYLIAKYIMSYTTSALKFNPLSYPGCRLSWARKWNSFIIITYAWMCVCVCGGACWL